LETTIAAQVAAQVVQQREADRRQRDEQRRAAATRPMRSMSLTATLRAV
jgi:hypothetical protein